MRVGLVCPYDMTKPGGVQSQVRDLARQLDAGGDEAVVIGPGLPKGMEGVDLGPTVSIPGNRSRVPLSADPRVVRAIKRAASDLDLLHVHEPLMPLVSFGALRADKPVVATFHAAPGSMGTGFYTVLRSQMKRLLGPNVRKITAVSRTAAGPLPDDLEVVIVPNGVDVGSFDLGGDRSAKQVSFLGRDEKRKGLDILLQAWATVSRDVPDAELLVMGARRDDDGIAWWGPVDEATKKEGLATSAIHVAPNLGRESFGIVLVEAMAAGAAVVASDLESFQEVGQDAIRYFRAGDSVELASTLVELLEDPTKVEKMSRSGRERARRFDWERVCGAYRNVYAAALS